MQTLSPALIAEYLICLIVGLIGIAVLWQIYDGTIDLSRLISEPNGDASMSRFQFLVFTFVIALSLFLVIAAGPDGKGNPGFPKEIPAGILTLLGISGSSYAVGKAIQFSDPAGIEDRPVAVTITPATVTVKYGLKQQFTAEIARKPDAKLKWEVVAGRGGIDPDTGLFRAPDAPQPLPAAPATAASVVIGPEHATVRVTCVDYPTATDLAVVTFA
jgi:hypothetical protein